MEKTIKFQKKTIVLSWKWLAILGEKYEVTDKKPLKSCEQLATQDRMWLNNGVAKNKPFCH